ncbi:hypothetical protein K6U26_01610, partial [Vibrio parahaemolyticus]|nr:hypothetical protein [Vibrio parahaemolyticus]
MKLWWSFYDSTYKNRSNCAISQGIKKAETQFCEPLLELKITDYFLRNPNKPSMVKANQPRPAP